MDDDIDLVKKFQMEAEKRSFHVKTQTSFAKAMEEISQEAFRARIIFFDLSSEKEPLTGFELIEKFNTITRKRLEAIVGVLTVASDLKTRTRLSQIKVDLFFKKPIKMEFLLDQLQEAFRLEEERTYKVLLLDDDLDFCKIIQEKVQSSKINLSTFSIPEQFFEQLTLQMPDLLLLDINLPEYNGLDFLNILRADFRFHNIQTIAITADTQPSTIERALNAGVQGFIAKPIDPSTLTSLLLNFFTKKHILSLLLTKNPVLGIYQKDSLEAIFQHLITQVETINIAYIQFLFPKEMEEKEKEDKWNQVCHAIHGFYSEKEIFGTWDARSLLFLFKDLKKKELRNLFAQLFSNIKEQMENIQAKVSLLSYPHEGKDLYHLVEKAKNIAKEEIEKQEFYRIYEEKGVLGQLGTSRPFEALFLSQDLVMEQVLQFLCPLHNIKIKVLKEGNLAIEQIQKSLFQKQLDIVIIDDTLTNPGAFFVIDKIQGFFGQRIPILFISSRKRDIDYLEMFEKGVKLFVLKPINLRVLMRHIEYWLQG